MFTTVLFSEMVPKNISDIMMAFTKIHCVQQMFGNFCFSVLPLFD